MTFHYFASNIKDEYKENHDLIFDVQCDDIREVEKKLIQETPKFIAQYIMFVDMNF